MTTEQHKRHKTNIGGVQQEHRRCIGRRLTKQSAQKVLFGLLVSDISKPFI